MESKRTWRMPLERKPGMQTMERQVEPYPATWFFDNMGFIGDEIVSCFIVDTSEGLILIDALFPTEHHLEVIENGIRDLGLDATDLKAILITHGHDDHFGKADELRKKYGCRIYMSEIDYNKARQIDRKPFNLQFDVDGYLEDGQDFTLGDTTIHCVMTPGHTDGCMSFIIPVSDEGRPHYLALWGGTGVLPTTDRQVYKDSVVKFDKICDKYKVDAEISNHPFVDNSIERLNVIRNISKGTPNPFVIGVEAYKRYEQFFYDMADKERK